MEPKLAEAAVLKVLRAVDAGTITVHPDDFRTTWAPYARTGAARGGCGIRLTRMTRASDSQPRSTDSGC